MDLFEKLGKRKSPLGPFTSDGYGYYTFPRLEGPIGPVMTFNGKQVIVWSVNDYLGIASHPDVVQADQQAVDTYGLSNPMGARLMTGNSVQHEALENELAEFSHKPAAYLLNYGYQGVASLIPSLLTRRDFLVYDDQSHACIVDGKQLAVCQSYAYRHNDIDNLEKQLQRVDRLRGEDSSVLVVTEGVFGMTGNLGKIREIAALKEQYNFRLLVDDAHGVGTLGPDGSGTGTELGCQQGIDIYFGTFAKTFALIGAFVATEPHVVDFLRANMRSQIFAKSLPLAVVASARKRLQLIREHPEWRNRLWENTYKLRQGLRDLGYHVLPSQSPITPVMTSGSTELCTTIMRELRENHGIFVSGVTYPVVPKGTVLLRLIPTAKHTGAHIEKTLQGFEAIRDTVWANQEQMNA